MTDHQQEYSDELFIHIDNKRYDITNWQRYHPGGKLVLQQYHDKDATDVFYNFHGEEAIAQLAKRKSTPSDLNDDQDPEVVAFRALRTELINDGWFKADPLWYTYKTLSIYGLALISLLSLIYLENWFIGAVFLGVFYQQMGWLGHDYCHHQVFKNRKLNNFVAYLTGSVGSGYSINWWKDRHNTHHAYTNVIEGDPDIDNLPLFSWSEADLARIEKGSLAEKIVPYQQYYFIAFTPLLKAIWCLQSILWLKDDTTQNESYKAARKMEAMCLVIHYLGVLYFLSWVPLASWAWFLMISEGIGGAGIALVVFMNHYACEKLDDAVGKKANFLTLQLDGTKNITPGIITDWVCGGLNYQIEHHLFPTLPRHNLSKLRPKIQAFCKDHGFQYQSADFVDCVKDVLDFLSNVAAQYRAQKKQKID